MVDGQLPRNIFKNILKISYTLGFSPSSPNTPSQSLLVFSLLQPYMFICSKIFMLLFTPRLLFLSSEVMILIMPRMCLGLLYNLYSLNYSFEKQTWIFNSLLSIIICIPNRDFLTLCVWDYSPDLFTLLHSKNQPAPPPEWKANNFCSHSLSSRSVPFLHILYPII